jgi:hypothetical protein
MRCSALLRLGWGSSRAALRLVRVGPCALTVAWGRVAAAATVGCIAVAATSFLFAPCVRPTSRSVLSNFESSSARGTHLGCQMAQLLT